MKKKRKNKGKILNIALSIAMMLSLFAGLSTIEVKAASSTHTHSGYTAINSSNWTILKNPGNYYLTENITIDSSIDITSGTVNLCLNGKKISGSSSCNTSLFFVENATLNIYDCVGNGILTGGKGYYNGSHKGGAIYLRHSKLNMYGGTITGNTATWGGAVFIDGSNTSSTFNMYGGTISSNTAQKGGGGIEVENNYSYLNIYAGSIINNSVTAADGGLHKGGGVHFAKGAVNIYCTEGDVIIKDNTVAGVENNLYLRSNNLITVPSSANITSNSKIGVSVADCEGGSSKETIVNSYGANNNRCFFVDGTNSSSHLMIYENGGVYIVSNSSHTHSWIQGEVIAPSINNVGIAYYTCATCGSIKEEKTYLSINDEKITIENANTLTYNGQVQSQKLNVYYDGELLSEDTHYTISDNSNTKAGNYNLTITGKGAFIGNRTVDYVINKVPLTVTVNNEELTYGDAVPMYVVTYSGFINDETKDVLTGALVINCDYAQYLNVGNYDIIASGYESDNYAITYVKGNVKVNPKEVGLVWGNLLFTYNGNDQLPTATVTGLINGDICTVTVTGAKENAGVHVATAEKLSNDNYLLPENATVEFVIQKVCEADEVTSEDKEVVKESLEIIENLLAEDNLTDEERDAIEQQKAELTEKLEKIEAAEESMKEVEEAVTSLPSANEVTSEEKGSIKETLENIEDLLAEENVGNLTDEEKTTIEEQKAELTEKLEKIEAAEEGMKEVEETVTSLPSANEVTSEEKESIEETLEVIENLLAEENVGNLTDGEKSAVEGQKAELIEKLTVIQKVEDVLVRIQDTKKDIPAKDVITTESKEEVDELLDAITDLQEDHPNNLTEEQKILVDRFKEELQEKMDRIQAIEDSLNKVEDETAAQPDYDDITSDNKEDIKDIIENIEKILEDAENNLSSEEKEALKKQKKDLEDKVAFIEKIEKYEPIVGDFENITKPEENDYNGDLRNESQELIEIIPLEKTEKEHVAKGDSVKVYLKVTDITETVSKEDKELIKAEFENGEVAVYLDFALFKQIGSRMPEKVSNTNKAVTITIQVPSNLINYNSSVTRKYQVVRVHKGEVSNVDIVYDEITGKITFETDKFSTYVLIYKDIAENVPDTGDVTVLWPWVLIMMGVGMIVLFAKAKTGKN